MIFNEYYPVFKAKGIERCIRTPELEENQAIHQLWKHFDPTIHVKRVTFKKKYKGIINILRFFKSF